MELLDLSQISARLKSQCNLLRTIGEAADFAAITDEAKNPPAAYVLPLRDEGFDESTQAHAGAMVSVHFGICMAVKNLTFEALLARAISGRCACRYCTPCLAGLRPLQRAAPGFSGAAAACYR